MRKQKQEIADFTDSYPVFTEEMKATHTILVPDMLPFHFEILFPILRAEGYKVEMLTNHERAVIDEGLKHVHNDTCFPALCCIGQYVDALKSGKYDPDRTAVLITQSGGGCRASNYIPLIRKALQAEFPQVPVLSLNFAGLEKDSSIKVTLPLLLKLAYGIFYGDTVMALYNQVRPYEKTEGAADEARRKCIDLVTAAFRNKTYSRFEALHKQIIATFAAVERNHTKKPRVGIVGEIYVKYSPLGNSDLEKFLLAEGCEPVVPSLMDFVLYCIINTVNDKKLYGHKSLSEPVFALVYKWLYKKQKLVIRYIRENSDFYPIHDFEELRSFADKVIHQGVKMGEGWLIPAEMAALCESDTPNVVCTQPFGCLPNHIAGKGATRAVKQFYPQANIVAVDYDPSATGVNQENRIKLMIATAKEALK